MILRFGAVGDVILTSPVIEAIARAWPDTRIVFGTRRPFAELVAAHPQVGEVLPLESGEGVWSYARRIRALGVDAVLDLHGQVRSVALRALLPGRRWASVRRRSPWEDLVVRLALRPWRPEGLLVERLHAAAESLAGPLSPGNLRYFPRGEDLAAAGAALRAAGIAPGAPVLGVTPGANWATKRWPIERFAWVARRAQEAGYRVMVTGSREESALAAVIRETVPEAVDLTGVSLGVMGGLLQHCRGLLANDSGPMHMARGLGVPTVAVFGSTAPGSFEWGGHGRIFAGVPCSPCHFYGRSACPRGHLACLMSIEPDAVWAELEPRLRGGRAGWVRG